MDRIAGTAVFSGLAMTLLAIRLGSTQTQTRFAKVRRHTGESLFSCFLGQIQGRDGVSRGRECDLAGSGWELMTSTAMM